ncbi:unnamed protein product [Fraxinus pennsylvanica]|uniref:Leucine-rich repeat-containing N-terminal plant-type domain-containing protein n=1 Tax=Fraxinus pennsylvanica TaxID=56036 RepID=A0AAD2DIZ9_9LAMI|nr:unnamed protein product [Fraxinus pennsylvanica]
MNVDAASVLRSLKDQWGNTPPSWDKSNDPCGGWDGISCSNSTLRVPAIPWTPNQNSSWGTATVYEKMVANTGSVGSWGTSRNDTSGSKEAWNKIGVSSENETRGLLVFMECQRSSHRIR